MTVPISDHPSKDRIEPGSFNVPVGKFPKTASSTSIDAAKVASEVIDRLNGALNQKNYKAVSDLFLEDGYWRDHLGLSWDYRTVKGSENIARFLEDSARLAQIDIDQSSPFRAPHVGPIDAFGEVTGVEFFTTFANDAGHGRGVVRLAEKDGVWKIFTVFTTLQELKGHEEAVNTRRPLGVQHGAQPGKRNWQDRRTSDFEFEGKNPVVLVIGAGQSGLTVAARLKMLNIDALVIDEEDHIGDNWRRRYHQLVLHDPVWFDHLPYLPFPPNWPIFTPKDKLAEFFEAYAKLLELNVWTRTKLKSSSWSDEKKQWTVVLERRRVDGSVESRTLHLQHVIQATGHSGEKSLPKFKGMESFKGDRICHSSEFTAANPASKGKKAVVVGSGNSGHDIAQDFYEKGYDVTMVQRSTTCVISSESIVEIGLKGLYEEAAPPTEDSDLYLWSIPSELFKAQQIKLTAAQNQRDAAILQGLNKAGFKVDMGSDNAGLLMKYLSRGGGYYIDVGGSQLIVDGKVKVKQGQEITEVLPHGLRFADGTQLEADEIVFATGYQNMKTQARAIFGDEVADRVESVWGFNEEGEMRTIWRQSGHPGFWYMGGNLALCRYYSRLLALQIKALVEGITIYGAK
ncbi:probable indole-3-pyruvate monooxygenase YUCCA11 [Aspergillus udagawae]|uniref:Probable indole-3-pyruvate monooxygenase YUCCA11 n=1 Tax=Aspergillus udagawae TaxID=91492 RepID=A0ABQ1B4I4_9EURO|nr:probable indole-3-pyruvate monooxygenase YUCCA11 [Aspergillus udagawae]GFG26413.1 probable indole-3-pyruvate monooxygenase YUCCA11 [Aspergillus udagawae]